MFFAAPLLGSAISPFIVMRIHRCISAYRANRLYAFPFLLSLDSIENLGSITSRCLIKGRALLPREGRPDTTERRKSSLQKTLRPTACAGSRRFHFKTDAPESYSSIPSTIEQTNLKYFV